MIYNILLLQENIPINFAFLGQEICLRKGLSNMKTRVRQICRPNLPCPPATRTALPCITENVILRPMQVFALESQL